MHTINAAMYSVIIIVCFSMLECKLPYYQPAFEIVVVRAPGKTKKVAGQSKILM